MNIRLKLAGAVVLATALFTGCSGDPGSGGSSGDITLTGVISTGAGASPAPGIKSATTRAADLTGYALYCVTFTVPPQSGTGNLTDNGDGTYGYSVTLTEAAGLPVGCFINDSTGVPVSTVTFNITDSAGLNSNTNGAALSGGEHTVNISFDPDTGTASAEVTSTSLDESNEADSTSASSLLTNMAGSWQMSCPTSASYTDGDELSQAEYDALTPCQQMLMIGAHNYDSVNNVYTYTWNGSSGGMSIYLNFVTGTQDGKNVYAMGVWPSETDFTNCGSTEGMSSAALTQHGVSIVGQTAATGNPVGTFSDGQATSVHAALVGGTNTYTVGTLTTDGDIPVTGNFLAIKQALHDGAVYPYDPTFNDAWSGGGTDWCDNASTLASFNADSATGRDERSCYADFMGWSMWDRAQSGDQVAACAPMLDTGNIHQIIWDWTGGVPSNTSANFTVSYRTTLGGVSPEIAGRHALMGLELVGGAAIANDHREEQWTQWFDSDGDGDWSTGTQVEATCKFVEDMSINMVPSTDANSATGRFTIKNFEGCKDSAGNTYDTANSGDDFNTFDVSFTKAP
ncbi:MAG: hypothetical protein HUJ29_02920 [Gammaproteobacteria bacterium]|nr:hypothetical protein [Gammaproteobacteria bacterium]